MVTPLEMLEAEMENLLANVAEDRKLIIQTLLEIRETVLNTLDIVNGELHDMGVDPLKLKYTIFDKSTKEKKGDE
tara:strand:- start:13 stop:237 length:225 start_codon:yes stop_codon:yes gene_type:complete